MFSYRRMVMRKHEIKTTLSPYTMSVAKNGKRGRKEANICNIESSCYSRLPD